MKLVDFHVSGEVSTDLAASAWPPSDHHLAGLTQ